MQPRLDGDTARNELSGLKTIFRASLSYFSRLLIRVAEVMIGDCVGNRKLRPKCIQEESNDQVRLWSIGYDVFF